MTEVFHFEIKQENELPLKKCQRGCDKPPKPPSPVLCEDCQARMKANLAEADERLKQMTPREE